uniref:Lipoprotein n=1 Tax=Streptomyces sp. NBC_00049 TaxID=2903617 RepID=A0AAU2JRS7_9ACTN
MSVYRKKTVGAALAAVLLVAGATACESGKKDDAGKAAESSAQPSKPAAGGSATEALTAAYKKTSAAKSAKVRMTMSMPAALDGGGTVELTGVQGWEPNVMDITMKGSLTPGQGAESIRMIMSNDVMFMEMPANTPMSAGMEGKRWMKLDIKAAAEASGDTEALKKLGGMGAMDQSQDPAKQLALLLASPNVKHVGAEKVDGTDAEHYKGTLSFDEMFSADESSKALTDAERAKLTEAMKKSGVKGYDMDVWVNKDGYPVHMKVGVGTPQGTMNIDASYSDYGSGATVQAPPENETFDLFAMLQELGKAGAGA